MAAAGELLAGVVEVEEGVVAAETPVAALLPVAAALVLGRKEGGLFLS